MKKMNRKKRAETLGLFVLLLSACVLGRYYFGRTLPRYPCIVTFNGERRDTPVYQMRDGSLILKVDHKLYKIDFVQKEVGSFNMNYLKELPLRRAYITQKPLSALDLASNATGKLGYDPQVVFTQRKCQFVDIDGSTISMQKFNTQ